MSGYQYVHDSQFRTWETRENPENWYGRVLYEGVPVICGHGGSMWLCRQCGEMALASAEWSFPKAPKVSL